MESVELYVQLNPLSEGDVKNETCKIKPLLDRFFKNNDVKNAFDLDGTVGTDQTKLNQTGVDSVDPGVKHMQLEIIKFYESHRSFYTHTFTTILQSIASSVNVPGINMLTHDAAVYLVIFM